MNTNRRRIVIRFATVFFLLLFFSAGGLFSYLCWYPSVTLPLQQLPEDCAEEISKVALDDSVLPSNCEVRRWYLAQVESIAKIDAVLRENEIATQQRALCAYAIRHQARIVARDKMPSRWEVIQLRWRDLRVYGNPDGPTFTSLLPDDSEASYLNIIQSAQQTNRVVNESCQGDSQ